jgi:hypothetical protein
MAAANVLLGLMLGTCLGGLGVVVAWGAALTIGSMVIIGGFHRRQGIPLHAALSGDTVALALTDFAGVAICVFAAPVVATLVGIRPALLGAVVYLAIAVFAASLHPARSRIYSMLGGVLRVEPR